MVVLNILMHAGWNQKRYGDITRQIRQLYDHKKTLTSTRICRFSLGNLIEVITGYCRRYEMDDPHYDFCSICNDEGEYDIHIYIHNWSLQPFSQDY